MPGGDCRVGSKAGLHPIGDLTPQRCKVASVARSGICDIPPSKLAVDVLKQIAPAVPSKCGSSVPLGKMFSSVCALSKSMLTYEQGLEMNGIDICIDEYNIGKVYRIEEILCEIREKKSSLLIHGGKF